MTANTPPAATSAERIQSLYAALYGVARALASPKSPHEFLTEVTRALVASGPFSMAFIAWRQPDSRELIPVASWGDTDGYSQRIRIYTDDRPEGHGPAGIAFRSGLPYTCDDFLTDPHTHPWREAARSAGWRASAAVPILIESQPAGILSVYAREAWFFGPKEVELLQQVAADIALAIETFDNDDRRRQAEAALAAGQRRLKLAMDAGGIGTYDWDLRTGDLFWQGHHERLFGFAPGEFDRTYATVMQRIHPDDAPALNQAIEQARDTRTAFAREFRVVWPGGNSHWVFSRGEFLYDGTGTPLRMYGAVVNIDERKHGEHALRKAEERLRNALDSMLEGCMIVGFDWTYLYVNEAAARHGLTTREQLVGRRMLDVFPGVEHSAVFARFRECMDHRIPQRFVESLRFPNGAIHWYEFSAVPVPEGIFILSLDVTERRLAEDALRVSEERLRQAVRVANIGIFDHDHVAGFMYLSPEQRLIHGFAPGERGTIERYLDLVHPEDRERIAALVRRAHSPSGDGDYDVEHRLLLPDGSIRWTSTRSQTFFEGVGPDRHPVRTVGAVRDITESKRAAEEKARLEAQLFHAQKMESIGRLAGGVAHDFNNLLTVINGYSGLLLGQLAPDAPFRPALEQIRKAGERAAHLTRQLLAFSRTQLLQPTNIHLNSVLAGMQPMLTRVLGDDIEFLLDLSPDAGHVHADLHQLEQVILNLAVNAKDALPHGGRLAIATAAGKPGLESSGVILTVSDTGIGMTEDVRQRIFEPFFTTKPAGKGTGLGLSMVEGLVMQSGGKIDVTSQPGRGTTFTISLPSVEPSSQEELHSDTAPANGGNETILIVEDQPDVRAFTAEALRAFGYVVLLAPSAAEALSLCERSHTDLVLTDLVMPEMSGRELHARLAGLRPNLKVLLMSGFAGAAGETTGLNFIQKPFTPQELAAKIRSVLGAP
jgi:two-component system cell cycle sensor histidine kinase/response regulator CckA